MIEDYIEPTPEDDFVISIFTAIATFGLPKALKLIETAIHDHILAVGIGEIPDPVLKELEAQIDRLNLEKLGEQWREIRKRHGVADKWNP